MRCASRCLGGGLPAALRAALLGIALLGCEEDEPASEPEARVEEAGPPDGGEPVDAESAISVLPDARFFLEDPEHDHEHPLTGIPLPPPSGAACPENTSLTYEGFGEPFMRSYCLECHSRSLQGLARHGAPRSRNFDSLEDIVTIALFIDQHAAAGPDSINTMMPPPGHDQPTMAERERLGQWLACEIRRRLEQ